MMPHTTPPTSSYFVWSKFHQVLLLSLLVWLQAFQSMAQGVVINEWMASNSSAVADEDGEFSDWIELYNSSNMAVQLQGYGLTDDVSIPFKWTFPSQTLAPNSFLLVFASDKDRKSGPYLHTNFKISAAGEPLQLVDAAGTVVDAVAAVTMVANASYGRQPDGSNNWVLFMSNATPGTSNPASGNSGLAVAPVFSQAAGFYTNPVTLSLSSTTVGGVIRYTLDGSEPTDISPLYSTPLVIQSKTGLANDLSAIPTNQVKAGPSTYFPPQGEVFKANVVRAKTFLAGASPSEAITQTYFVDLQINQRYSFPVISIATDRDGFFGGKAGIYVPGDDFNGDNDRSGNYYQRGSAWERAANIEFFDTDRTKGFSQRVGVRIHGSASRVDPQKSLRIYADEKYGKASIQYPIFPDKPISEYKRFVLRNGGNDRSVAFIRDIFTQNLVKDLNLDTQASRSAIVFVNGEYWGIHHLDERIDKYYLASNHGVPADSLDLLEMDRVVNEGDATHYQQMLDFMKSHDMRIKVNFDTVAKRMDMEEFINYQIAELYAANVDWPGNNLDYWRPRKAGGKWRWIFYDLDFAFGLTENSTFVKNMLTYATDPNGPTFPTPNAGNSPYGTFLLRTLLENDTFKTQFINRFADLLNTHFKTERVVAQLDQTQANLAPAMPEHIARWGAPASVSQWNSNVEVIRTFAQQRPAIQRQHLIDFFNLGGTAQVSLNVSDTAQGRVQINSVIIDKNTVGATSAPYPWQGIYFKNTTIRLTALPKPGFKFLGWSDASLPQEPSIQLSLQQDLSVTAIFDAEGVPTLAMPSPFDLSQGEYTFTEWSAQQPATSFPANMAFQRTSSQDPIWSTDETTNYTSTYNLTSGSRINGLGTDGFSFINTGTNGHLGAAVLALNTTGRTNIRVGWTGGTVTPNTRIYSIRLQYKVGNSAWTNIPGALEYVRNATAGHSQQFSLNVSLATSHDIDDQPLVYVRWKYYFVSGNSGPRAELRVGDISVSSTAPAVIPTRLAIVSVNGNRSPSRNGAFSITVQAQDDQGHPQNVNSNTNISVSLATGSGSLSGNFSGTILNGQHTLILTGLRYDKAEAGVSLTATRNGGVALLPATSPPFTVLEAASKLIFVGNYNYGAAGISFQPFSIAAKRADNSLDASFTGNVTIAIASGGGSISGTLTRPCVAGVADFSDIVFAQGGLYTLLATATSLTSVPSTPIKVAGLMEVMIPRFIQGTNGDNTNRVPYAFRATLHHLNDNAKYRFFNQVVLPVDGITADGAGNVIYVNGSESTRVTSLSVDKPGQYSEFTTDANGSYTGWFVTEPTGNNRFTPGNQIRMRLVLNDGGGGSDPFFRLTGNSLVTVVDFGNETTQGSALIGNSCATARNIITLYDTPDTLARPITATIVENDGVENSAKNNYAPFYADQVNAQKGTWGAIIPNNLPNGIRRIEQRSLASGNIIGFSTSANGTWGTTNTANPVGGSPLVIAASFAILAPLPVITQEASELVSSLATGNQWFLGNTPIAGATAQRYTPTQNGQYRVLSNGADCPFAFSQPIDFAITSVPNQTPSQTLRLYPNPTDGKVQVSFRIHPMVAPVEIRLLNVLGQEMYHRSLESQTGEYDTSIDLSGEQNGLYLLQIFYGEQVLTRKLVLQQ
ncbi:MAG: CotH kinase family protein [Bacteroidota bacterium]